MEITTPAEYEVAFRQARASSEVSGVCGRIVRGKEEADFERLSYTRGRRLAWVYGSDGLQTLLRLSHSEMVLSIGKGRTWLREEVAKGFRWKLFVFPERQCTLGDWAGLWSLIERHYADVFGRLERWRSELESRTLLQCTGELGFDRREAKRDGHPAHMSVDRYLSAEDTLRNARLLLWHALGINELYAGTGYATGENGQRGGREYLIRNVPVAEIEELVSLELTV